MHTQQNVVSRCLIIYFSLGGTTKLVAESIAAGLLAAGYQIDLHDMLVGKPPDPRDYDLLGIGSPTQYFRAPFKVLDCVQALPDLDGLAAFVFVLYGAIGGDAGKQIRHALSRKNAHDVGCFSCLGADYYLPYLLQGYLFSPEHPTEAELSKAEEFGRQVAARKTSPVDFKAGEDKPLAAIYRLERFLVHRCLVQQVYSRMFRVIKDRCTVCDLCIQECPMRNIAKGADTYPVFGRNCLLCLNCEMKCPEDAIKSPVTGLLFWPFLKYNVSAILRDSVVDNVRVKHRKGKTQRL